MNTGRGREVSGSVNREQINRELDEIAAWLRRYGRQPSKLQEARTKSARAKELRGLLQ